MKKRKRTLALLCALLVVFIAGYIVISVITAEPEEKASTGTVYLYSAGKESISEISYTYKGENYSFIKTDGTWRLEADPAFPLDSTKIDAMINVLYSVTTTVVVDEAQANFADFGLDDPELIIFCKAGDGESVTLTVGDQNSYNNMFYTLSSGAEGVYMLALRYIQPFRYNLNALALPDSVPAMRSSNVRRISISGGGGNVVLEQYDAGSPQLYTDEFSYVLLGEGGAPVGAKNSLTSTLLNTIVSMAADSCADYSATDEEMIQCGLDGSRRLTVDYVTGEGGTVKTFELTVGEGYDENYTYVRIGSSRMICLMDSAAIDYVMGLTPEGLKDMNSICLLSANDLSAMSIEFGGEAYEFEVNRKGEHTAEYFLNGRELKSTDFKSFFTTINTLKAGGFAEEFENEEPYMVINFSRSGEHFSELSLRILPYDDSSYRVELDTFSTQLVAKADIEAVVAALREL